MARKRRTGPASDPELLILASLASGPNHGYGIMADYEGRRAPFELPTAVYRIDPNTGDGEATVSDLERPNGLCFSPDESRLYVVDSSTPYIYVYDANPGGQARNGRIFADLTPASSDGIRCDEDGNLWASVAGGEPFDGVYVFDLDGARIGHVMLPERCANLCFGGPARNRLFMAASQSVYALYVNTRGC